MSIGSFRFESPPVQGFLRSSVLGRAAARKMRSIVEDASDDAVPSPATKSQMQAYLDAWRNSDKTGLERALNKVVEGWRTDNSAGGVPVHAHLPLPDTFAEVIARLAREEVPGQGTLADIVAKLDPGIKTLVSQQISDLSNREILGHDRRGGEEDGHGAARDVQAIDHDTRWQGEPSLRDEPLKLDERIDVDNRYRAADAYVHHALRSAEHDDEVKTPAEQLGGRSLVDLWERPRDRRALGNGAPRGASSNLLSSAPRAPSRAKAYKMQGHDAEGRPFVRRIFELEEPADAQNGGYIVQTVTVEYYNSNGRRIYGPITWSEAWRVAPGDFVPEHYKPEDQREILPADPAQGVPAGNDSIRPLNPLPRGVTMVVHVSWRFYDNVRTLPSEFRRRSREPDHPAGDLLATDVGKVAEPARIGGTPGPVQSDIFRLQQK